MSEKYIRENKTSCTLIKGSRSYGKFSNLDDAVFARDLLIQNDWNLDSIGNIQKEGDEYVVTAVIEDKLHILARQDNIPSQERIDRLIKGQIRNPNNSKYGLNITRVFDTYMIKKQISGDDYVFGYYDSLQDAEFVRNYLMDNDWDVNAFSQVQYDEETSTYKVVEVIDDKVYVLGTFTDRKEIDVARCHGEFLNRIAKHKLGLAQHPHLSELSEKIPALEERFGIEAHDDVWSLRQSENPLNDIIFNLTPFQKSVYDSIDNSTFEDVKKSMIRYKSGNFDEKIQKNLDELEKSGLICRKANHYMKKDSDDI